MADNYRVLDCLVSELQANLNLWAGEFTGIVWNIYDKGEERRATVVMSRLAPVPVTLPPGFDPLRNRRN